MPQYPSAIWKGRSKSFLFHFTFYTWLLFFNNNFNNCILFIRLAKVK